MSEVKCEYCGAVFFVGQESDQQKAEDEIDSKIRAFKDTLEHTGGEEQHPEEAPALEESESLSKTQDDDNIRAVVTIVMSALFIVLFLFLLIEAYSTQDFRMAGLYTIPIIFFSAMLCVGYIFLPKGTENSKTPPDYTGD